MFYWHLCSPNPQGQGLTVTFAPQIPSLDHQFQGYPDLIQTTNNCQLWTVGHKDVLLDIPASISEFSQKYVVDEHCVCEYVQNMKCMNLMKAKRSAEIDRKAQSNAKTYDDYDWEELYRQGKLSKLCVRLGQVFV